MSRVNDNKIYSFILYLRLELINLNISQYEILHFQADYFKTLLIAHF